jgi:prepilin-type N-terminal cleavage/methylation domain-containing protein/prepilin-type processing-associated H-X9-DG protein
MANNFSRAFTFIELLVVMIVIGILASIAYPVYTGTLERAKVTQDMNNLRQIGLGIQTYLNDNDQVLPATTIWPGTTATPVLYPKYIATRKVFQSAFDKRPSLETDLAPVSYSINANMYAAAPGINRNMTSVVSPASTILMAPKYNGNPANAASWAGTATSAPDLPPGGTGETRGTHSNGTRINALFCDLHTESLTFSLTGPPYPAGTFQDTTSDPLGLKHWDPTK